MLTVSAFHAAPLRQQPRRQAHALGAEHGTVFLGQGFYIFKHGFPWQHAKCFNDSESDAAGDALQGFVFLQLEQRLK